MIDIDAEINTTRATVLLLLQVLVMRRGEERKRRGEERRGEERRGEDLCRWLA